MGKHAIHIVAVIALFFLCPDSNGKQRSDKSFPYIETRVDRTSAMLGEKLIYEVVLYSADPNVAGAEIIKNPDFRGLDFSRSASDSHLEEVEKGGIKVYSAVIDRFFIAADHTGKFSISGGEYRIGYNRQVEINDPFWGSAIASRIETVNLEAPDLKIRVNSLPSKEMPENFSGAVGDFEIETELPGNAISGEDICLLITIAGKGDLSEALLPSVRGIFGDGLHFKSMTENRTHFIQQGSVGSEMEIECVFMADNPGRYVIHPVEFSYFDSVTGKYVTIRSSEIEIEINERKSDNEAPPAVMDI